jgi:hypothetical protein
MCLHHNVTSLDEKIILAGKRKFLLIPVAALSKAWVCGRSFAGVADSNHAEGKDVCCECCVLSDRGTCVGLITRPEESYRACCVSECDRETLIMKGPSSCVLAAGRKLQTCSLEQLYHKIVSGFRFISAIMPVIVLWIVTPLTVVCCYHQLILVLTLPAY